MAKFPTEIYVDVDCSKYPHIEYHFRVSDKALVTDPSLAAKLNALPPEDKFDLRYSICPLTNQLVNEPCRIKLGHRTNFATVYEREAIHYWLSQHNSWPSFNGSTRQPIIPPPKMDDNEEKNTDKEPEPEPVPDSTFFPRAQVRINRLLAKHKFLRRLQYQLTGPPCQLSDMDRMMYAIESKDYSFLPKLDQFTSEDIYHIVNSYPHGIDAKLFSQILNKMQGPFVLDHNIFNCLDYETMLILIKSKNHIRVEKFKASDANVLHLLCYPNLQCTDTIFNKGINVEESILGLIEYCLTKHNFHRQKDSEGHLPLHYFKATREKIQSTDYPELYDRIEGLLKIKKR